MDKFMSLTQLAMTAVVLLCVIVLGIAHIINGTIGFVGALVVAGFAYLILVAVYHSWKEFKNAEQE